MKKKSGNKIIAVLCAGLFSFLSADQAAMAWQMSPTPGTKVRLLPISFSSPAQPQEVLPKAAGSEQQSQDSNSSNPLTPRMEIPRSLQDGTSNQQEGVVKLLKPLSVETKEREVITRRYPSGETQLVREVVLDNNGNYISDGRWRLYGTDKQLIGKGQFRDGFMIGNWKRLHLDRNHPWLRTKDFQSFTFPLISSADFEAGQLEGLWQIADKNQKKVVEFYFSKGKRQGSWIWYFANGEKRREIQFDKGLIHGRWIEWDEQGKKTKEDWYQEGQRIYKVTSYFEQDKPETQSTFMAGKLELAESDDWWNAKLAAYNQMGPDVQHGPIQSWYDNGQKHMVGYFKNGQRDGVFAWWHPNGVRKSFGQFEAGKQIGDWRWWFDNGIKESSGVFKDGIADGRWIKWDRKGNPIGDEILDSTRQKLARPAFEGDGNSASPISPQIKLNGPGGDTTEGFSKENAETLPSPKGLPDNNPIQNENSSQPEAGKANGDPVGAGLNRQIPLTPAGSNRIGT